VIPLGNVDPLHFASLDFNASRPRSAPAANAMQAVALHMPSLSPTPI
jgi:hypothetical protein